MALLAMSANANNTKASLAGAKVDNFMLIDQQRLETGPRQLLRAGAARRTSADDEHIA